MDLDVAWSPELRVGGGLAVVNEVVFGVNDKIVVGNCLTVKGLE
jgi:hypothetical protein